MMKEEFGLALGSSPNMDELLGELGDNIYDEREHGPLLRDPAVTAHDQEETMQAPANYEWHPPVVYFPVLRLGPPERHVFAGTMDFQVEINGSDTHKRKYLYSAKLNRIYVDMRTNFPVQFRWSALAPAPLYVRATVAFSDEAQQQKRVERCTQHTHDATNAGLKQEVIRNVLHSARDMGTQGVHYCGVAECSDSWYSVLVEFPRAATDAAHRHAYQLVCKNSCSSGINRRAIEIVFELEDAAGHIYGRQIVEARCCSCPPRDMKRDERDEGLRRGGKRRMAAALAAPPTDSGKRVKLEVVQAADSDIITLEVDVIGVRAALAGLNATLAVMEYDASLQTDPQVVERYQTKIAQLKTKIQHYNSIRPTTP